MDPCTADAFDIVDAIGKGDLSAVQIAEAIIARIQSANPSVNCMVAHDPGKLRARAAELDAWQEDGKPLGPLHGVPLSVKDLLDAAGYPTSAGVVTRTKPCATVNAAIVARAEAAGAMVVGKTNVPELGDAVETDNAVFGCTSNPYDLSRTPGGSSGGEAASVASGMSAIGLGTDSGGSIRIPAHFCGLASIKPTYGRLPRTGLFPPAIAFNHERNQPGPLARSMRDVARVLPLLCGPDGVDPTVVPFAPPNPEDAPIRGMRVAVFDDNGVVASCAQTRAVIHAAADSLANCGAQIVRDRPEGIAETAELMFGHRPETDARSPAFLELTGGQISQLVTDSARAAREYARTMTTAEFFAYVERLNLFRMRMYRFMAQYDLILCPVLASFAPPHRGLSTAPEVLSISYTQTFNLCGWPSGTVNAGWSTEGLPIGVQLSAAPWNDAAVLSAGIALELANGGFRAPKLQPGQCAR